MHYQNDEVISPFLSEGELLPINFEDPWPAKEGLLKALMSKAVTPSLGMTSPSPLPPWWGGPWRLPPGSPSVGMLMASCKERKYVKWRSQPADWELCSSRQKWIGNTFKETSKDILVVWAFEGSIGGLEERNCMVGKAAIEWTSKICLKMVLKIEKEAHFPAGWPFAIRNGIVEMAICNGKQD